VIVYCDEVHLGTRAIVLLNKLLILPVAVCVNQPEGCALSAVQHSSYKRMDWLRAVQLFSAVSISTVSAVLAAPGGGEKHAPGVVEAAAGVGGAL